MQGVSGEGMTVVDPNTEGPAAHGKLSKKKLYSLYRDGRNASLYVEENTTAMMASVPPDGVQVQYEDLTVRNGFI